jgi:hypothetical protein
VTTISTILFIFVLKKKTDQYLTMKFWTTIVVAFVFILGGCNDQNRCYDSVDTRLVAIFKVSDFRVYDTLYIHGVGRIATGDTLVFDTLSAQSKRLALPLSLSADSTGFIVFTGTVSDTFYLHHTMIMKFISEYCGFAPEYKLTGSFFTKGIDSLTISDPVVNTQSLAKNINDQNVTIYFNPSVIH